MSTAASTGAGTGGSVPCGGNTLDGHMAAWATHAGDDIAAGMGIALTAGGDLIVVGSYQDDDTTFKTDPLPYPTPDGGEEGYDLFVAQYDATGAPQWAIAFNGPMDQRVSNIALDATGNIFIGGLFQGSIDFSASVTISSDVSEAPDAYDGFVAKLDPSGNPTWAVPLGTSGDDEVSQIALDGQGNVIVAGVTSGQQSTLTGNFGCGTVAVEAQTMVFLTKLDPNGVAQWCRLYPVSNEFYDYSNPPLGLAVAVAPDGQIVLAGGFSATGSTSFGQGQLETFGENAAFVFVADAGGNYVWAQSYGDMAGSQWATQVAVDACGDILLGGGFHTSVTFDGVNATAPVDATPGSAFNHIFLAKLTSQGATQPAVGQWLKGYADSGNQFLSTLALDTAGDAALTGLLQDDGNSKGVDLGNGVLLPAVNLAYSAGSYRGNAFVARVDGAGTARWGLRYSGLDGESGNAVTLDDQGHTLVAGQFEDTIDFVTSKPLKPFGDDLFVMKLGP